MRSKNHAKSLISSINAYMALSKSGKNHREYCTFGGYMHRKGVKAYLGAMRFLVLIIIFILVYNIFLIKVVLRNDGIGWATPSFFI